jgi:hypothetical protein
MHIEYGADLARKSAALGKPINMRGLVNLLAK